jgi:hypothetical protein
MNEGARQVRTGFKMRVRLVPVPLFLASTAAQAQWINQKFSGSFDDDTLYVAVTNSNNLVFGLRCKPSRTPEVLLITNEESMTAKAYKFANDTDPKLRIKIDDGEILSFDTTLKNSPEGKTVAVSGGNLSLFEKIREAKTTIAVVVTVLAKNFYEGMFNSRGIKEAVSQLISSCKLSDAKK